MMEMMEMMEFPRSERLLDQVLSTDQAFGHKRSYHKSASPDDAFWV